MSTQSTDNTQPPADGGTPPSSSGDGAPSDQQELSHEALRAELTKARGDAANYRTRLREAETKLAEAKTPQDLEAAVAEMKSKNDELEASILRATVAGKHGLPAELAKRLAGKTEAELEADALALAKFAESPAAGSSTPPRGGLNPTDDDDGETDPRALARKYRRKY